MHMLRACRNRFATWAMAALVFAIMHPAIAGLAAGAAAGRDPLTMAAMQVCTTGGMQRVQADAAEESGDTPLAQTAGASHCPLCRALGDLPLDLSRTDLHFALNDTSRPAPPQVPRPAADTVGRVVRATPVRAPPTA